MESTFKKGDEFGLGVGSMPHFAIKLTKEEAELVSGKKPELYTVDGKALFEVGSSKERVTGEQAFFVVFI